MKEHKKLFLPPTGNLPDSKEVVGVQVAGVKLLHIHYGRAIRIECAKNCIYGFELRASRKDVDNYGVLNWDKIWMGDKTRNFDE